MTVLEQFRSWIEKQATEKNYFSGTFWFLFSSLHDADFARILDFRQASPPLIPTADQNRTVLIQKRTGTVVQATFWRLPIRHENVHILFSLDNPTQALRPMYHLLSRTRGKVNLLPLGYPVV